MGKSRKEAAASPFWKRLEAVMQVQTGLISVREACRNLGITPPHYYRLEERILAQALAGATPGKRGPKREAKDPRAQELEEENKKLKREGELRDLKMQELTAVNEGIRREVLTWGAKAGKMGKGGGEEAEQKKKRGREGGRGPSTERGERRRGAAGGGGEGGAVAAGSDGATISEGLPPMDAEPGRGIPQGG